MVLPRLSWLAPAKASEEDCLSWRDLHAMLAAQFENDSMPVMVALMEPHEGILLEVDRGFIVPSGWPERAGERITRMTRAS
jgi:hypothetical protein